MDSSQTKNYFLWASSQGATCVENIQPVNQILEGFSQSHCNDIFFIYIFYYNKISLHYNAWRENTLRTFLNS